MNKNCIYYYYCLQSFHLQNHKNLQLFFILRLKISPLLIQHIQFTNRKLSFCLITQTFSPFTSKPNNSISFALTANLKSYTPVIIMKHSFAIWTVLFLQLTLSIIPAYSLGNECGIKFCTSCDPQTNFCFQCDRPYKPGFTNQTICTRCANNCAVCEKAGQDSKGRCLSCVQNYDYALDDHCNIFYIWVYVVTIACYALFGAILFIVFCLIKRRNDRKQIMWFENLKNKYNKIDRQVVAINDFEKMCNSLVELLKESSSYNSLKFKDREYEKAMKIKQITIKNVPRDTHIKKIKIVGSDNSEFTAKGFVYVQDNSNGCLKMWVAKNYKRKVFSQQISKIIIYESDIIDQNEIKGRWYYYGAEEICGTWRGLRHQIYLDNFNNVNQP